MNKVIAKSWRVKKVGDVVFLQLFDAKGRAIPKDAYTVWEGDFNCNNSDLTSLQGSPKEVAGSFYCYNNNLISLQGAPTKINGDFDCADNKLTSLKYVPKEIGNIFYYGGNNFSDDYINAYIVTIKCRNLLKLLIKELL